MLRPQGTGRGKPLLQPLQASGSLPSVIAGIESGINELKGGGLPLPESVRSFFEPRFGRDFSKVRLHADRHADALAQTVQASAFTVGNDIVFSAGGYSPGTTEGKRLLSHELTHVAQQEGADANQHIFRKISVKDFDAPIPNPGGKGLTQTKEEAVLDYVFTLCPDTPFMVQGGKLSFLDDSFCKPSVLTHDGLFSKAEMSKTSTSCTCLCDTILAPDDIEIDIDDTRPANTSFGKNGGMITAPSPNARNIPRVQSASGRMIDSPPFIVFAHELCGHYWLNMHGVDEKENLVLLSLGRDGHDPAIKRENLIRQEHGLEKRGTFRDPCCGIGNPTSEDLKRPSGRCGAQFERQKNIKGTLANECKHWREEYNKLNGTNFTTDDAIPEKQGEKRPAKWRIEIFFKKDAPQPWLTLDQSLTREGKEGLELVVKIANKHKDMNLQLTGNASSDKPAGDPTYNKRLGERRAQSILSELIRRGAEKQRFRTFDEACDKIQEGVHNCGDEKSEKKTNEQDRNVEVKIFNP